MSAVVPSAAGPHIGAHAVRVARALALGTWAIGASVGVGCGGTVPSTAPAPASAAMTTEPDSVDKTTVGEATADCRCSWERAPAADVTLRVCKRGEKNHHKKLCVPAKRIEPDYPVGIGGPLAAPDLPLV